MRKDEAMAKTSSLNLLANFELVVMFLFTSFQKPHCQGANMVAITDHECNLWLDYMPLPGCFAGTVLPKSHGLVQQGKRPLQTFDPALRGSLTPTYKGNKPSLSSRLLSILNNLQLHSALLLAPSHIINKYERASKAHNGCHRYQIPHLHFGNCFPWHICCCRY